MDTPLKNRDFIGPVLQACYCSTALMIYKEYKDVIEFMPIDVNLSATTN
jgi:hypothetical protein